MVHSIPERSQLDPCHGWIAHSDLSPIIRKYSGLRPARWAAGPLLVLRRPGPLLRSPPLSSGLRLLRSAGPCRTGPFDLGLNGPGLTPRPPPLRSLCGRAADMHAGVSRTMRRSGPTCGTAGGNPPDGRAGSSHSESARPGPALSPLARDRPCLREAPCKEVHSESESCKHKLAAVPALACAGHVARHGADCPVWTNPA